MRPAARVAELKPSAIRLIADHAPPDAIPLGLGQPTWDLPQPARDAMAGLRGPCPYGPNSGRADLRAAIAEFHGLTGPDQVLVTIGTQGALFCLFCGLLDPGDQVLLPDPGFVAYPALAALFGAEPVLYALSARDRFRLDPAAFLDRLAQAPRARAAVLNIPSNPTGGGAAQDALQIVAEACRARGVALISDEVYRDLHFGTRPPTLLDVAREGTVVVSSMSKAFGAPGLRVGWVAGDPALIRPAAVVNGYAATAAAHPCQGAALALLAARDAVLPAARAEVGVRFAALQRALREHLGMDASPPDGSFYHWLPLPEAAWSDPVAFCLRLRDEARVVLIPGLVFGEGGRRHARLSFAASPAQLEEGVRRLAPYFRTP